ncbi:MULTISPECIES: glucosaminidase domain-containing protein [Clostridium]|uniref:glucosaminidase domain-containing protein n=1 Tax=Clostridium TaxID=1485 RepID=UPI00069D8009|nr:MULTISPECIES: glucosaminidase domain-containing protein [Clostridium]KOF57494.1 hypothetical protein AGR56_14070 [Clostridium sp. DMHC 10]MCD2345885.1 glucosaminidase domain-containing protein [Clostridium guangxiense]
MGMKKLLVVVIFAFLVLMSKTVQAVEVDTFPTKTEVDMNKEWKITFNKPIDPESINSSNFKVMDSTRDVGVKVKTDKSDSRAVIVELPTLGYVPGKTYTLNVSQDVKCQDGKVLSKPIKMDFTVSSTMVDGTKYDGGPVIYSCSILNKTLSVNDKLLLNIKSSGDKVKYRIFLYKFNYVGYRFENYREITNGYTNAVDAATFNFQYDKPIDEGDYKVVVYVKNQNNMIGTHEDGNTDFDNYYTNYFRCVSNTMVSSGMQNITNKNYSIALDKIVNEQFTSNSSKYEIRTYWTSASKNIISYYMNPDNFMDDVGKYMFMKIDKTLDNVTADDLNAVLKGKGTLEGMGQTFIDAANKYKINVVYLLYHALHESSNGTSNLSSGNIKVNGKSTYNFFGIRADDSDPEKHGSQYAYDNGWFTPKDAIEGGIKFIAENYIYSATPVYSDRKTLYAMKWNPSYPASYQYATDVEWAYTISKSMYNSFKQILDKNVITYEIPKFQ